MWANVECGRIHHSTDKTQQKDASPYAFTVIPSYMLNECWEFVGRFSYVNSDKMGMTIQETFGCAPDNGKVRGQGGAPTFVSSKQIFEKVYAGYLGVNYYMMNQAVKASLGFAQARFKNRVAGEPAVFNDAAGSQAHKGAKVNSVRAQLQFLF